MRSTHCPARAVVALVAAIVVFAIVPAMASTAARELQARLDSARNGDTVVVDGGTFDGNLTVSRTLHLIGRNTPVLRGSGEGSVVTILVPGCTVEGFVIEKSGGQLVNEDAGILVKAGHTTIRGNELRDVLFGVYLYQSDSNRIEGNRILGRPGLDQGGRGSGIHVWNANGNVIGGNVITGTRDGIYIQNANRLLVMDNEVYGVRYGLHYMYADTNTFLRNVFRDNVAGAAIMFTKHIVMKHNRFIRNRGYASYGLLLQDCHDSVADSNLFADNVVGLFFESSTRNAFRRNVIARNDLALRMFQNSEGNVFTENDFIDNLDPLAVVGRRTGSAWSTAGRGNYWSSYDGYDLDDDGIGDVPLTVGGAFSYLEGRNANVRLYLYSPASQALGASAKAFPILETSEEIDPHPLMTPVAVIFPVTRTPAPGDSPAGHSVASFMPWLASAVVSGVVVLVRRRRKASVA